MPSEADGAYWSSSVARFWRRSYAADYLSFALLVAIYVPVVTRLEPFHRMFSLDDRSKSYPHALVERVPPGQNILYAGVLPMVLQILWLLVKRPGLHQSHVTILGFLIGLFLTLLLTDIVKNSVGRPRPDLLARCKPRAGTPKHELVTIEVCTESNHHMLQDGWRSFPSGHSSFAFAGFGYLALMMAGQMLIFRPGCDLARCLLSLLPLIAAALIAISRLEDYRHDAWDVAAGSLLGLTVAYFSYRRYYRPLRHPKCNIPYPSRADWDKNRATTSRGDEEQQAQDPVEIELADTDDERSESMPLNRQGHVPQSRTML